MIVPLTLLAAELPPLAPWTERNRWIFWLALAFAACAVGWLALRALRSND